MLQHFWPCHWQRRQHHGRRLWLLFAVLFAYGSFALASSTGFTPLAGNMTAFDPAQQVFPTSGDRIKVAVFFPFSGAAAINGHIAWANIGWAVHDVNTQGGIWVDGKKKKSS